MNQLTQTNVQVTLSDLKCLYNGFPRQFGRPNKVIVKTEEEFYEAINRYNGMARCFGSLYNWTPGQDKGVILDKLWFDFDSPRSQICAGIAHKWLLNNQIRHCIIFSGGGFHIYVFANPNGLLKNVKWCLENTQRYLVRQWGLSIGESKIADVDQAIIGDIARVATIPGTYNIRRRKWAISLTPDELALPREEIERLANTQRRDLYTVGSILFDTRPFDGTPEQTLEPSAELPEGVKREIEEDQILKSICPTVAKMLLDCRGLPNSNRERFLVIIYLIDSGYTRDEVTEILRRFLPPNKFHHCIYEEHQVDHLWNAQKSGRGYIFPAPEKLKAEGKWVEPNCQCIKKLYY